jgi:predicted 3-demethylubiquinone-9 3-methyltransferase (glyoxalase superfamily)
VAADEIRGNLIASLSLYESERCLALSGLLDLAALGQWQSPGPDWLTGAVRAVYRSSLRCRSAAGPRWPAAYGVEAPRRALIEHQELRNMKPKNTVCLWFDKDAHEAARFYAATFPDSEVTAVHKAPGDYPGGKRGDVLTVEFTVLGIPCLGLNGGPQFRHSEAFSFQIATDNQQETDRYWNAIVGNGGTESRCGWCRDRWGLSWQITPRALTEALAAGGGEAKLAFEAMMPMKKIDIAAIEAARQG